MSQINQTFYYGQPNPPMKLENSFGPKANTSSYTNSNKRKQGYKKKNKRNNHGNSYQRNNCAGNNNRQIQTYPPKNNNHGNLQMTPHYPQLASQNLHPSQVGYMNANYVNSNYVSSNYLSVSYSRHTCTIIKPQSTVTNIVFYN